MEQRLRLVQGGHQPRSDKRTSERRSLAVPGQIVWKDARGDNMQMRNNFATPTAGPVKKPTD